MFDVFGFVGDFFYVGFVRSLVSSVGGWETGLSAGEVGWVLAGSLKNGATWFDSSGGGFVVEGCGEAVCDGFGAG